MLMGKGYSLLASGAGGGGSGRAPSACTAASWTARFSSSDDADAEHDEMVNELQAMVRIGNEWANASDHDAAAADDDDDDEQRPLTNVDPDTARSTSIEDATTMNESTENDVNESGSTTEVAETFQDDFTELYSTTAKSTCIIQSSPPPDNVSSPVDRASPTCESDVELLPFPVYEDARPPRDALPLSLSPSHSVHLGSHEVKIVVVLLYKFKSINRNQ